MNWPILLRRQIGWRLLPEKKLILSTEPVMVRQPLLAGEFDFSNRCLADRLEVAWLYSHDEGTWFNLTEDHAEFFSDDPSQESFSGVQKRRINYYEYGRRLTEFHTHPSGVTYHFQDRRKIENLTKNKMPWEFISVIEAPTNLMSSLPSRVDLIEAIHLNSIYQGITFDFAVASPYGVVVTEVLGDTRSIPTIRAYYDGALAEIKSQPFEFFLCDSHSLVQYSCAQINHVLEGIVRLSWHSYTAGAKNLP